jgi:hypothetical protein
MAILPPEHSTGALEHSGEHGDRPTDPYVVDWDDATPRLALAAGADTLVRLGAATGAADRPGHGRRGVRRGGMAAARRR